MLWILKYHCQYFHIILNIFYEELRFWWALHFEGCCKELQIENYSIIIHIIHVFLVRFWFYILNLNQNQTPNSKPKFGHNLSEINNIFMLMKLLLYLHNLHILKKFNHIHFSQCCYVLTLCQYNIYFVYIQTLSFILNSHISWQHFIWVQCTYPTVLYYANLYIWDPVPVNISCAYKLFKGNPHESKTISTRMREKRKQKTGYMFSLISVQT